VIEKGKWMFNLGCNLNGTVDSLLIVLVIQMA
jgi:hypothetical protein